CLNNLAMIAQRRDSNEAYDLYSRSLEIMRELQDPVGVGVCLNNLGTICKILGHYRLARTMYIESLEIRERLEDKQGMGVCFNNLGLINYVQGNYYQAEQYFVESILLSRSLSYKQAIATGLIGLALLANRNNQPRLAVQLVATVDTYLDGGSYTKNMHLHFSD